MLHTPHPLLRTIGAAIRSLRRERGLSQESLADVAHIDRSYMSAVERGLRNISVLKMARIASALDVPVRNLLDTRDVRWAWMVDRGPRPAIGQSAVVLPPLRALRENASLEWEPGRYLSLG